MLIVAGRAARRAEFASVHVAVTIGARGVLQAPIATRYGKLRKMAAIARDLRVHPFQWKGGHRMRAKTDSSWQTEPTNVGVAVVASVSEPRLVHLGVAGDALRARARRVGVALVVTRLALRLGMTTR